MAIKDPVTEMPSLRLLRALYRTLDEDLAACFRYVEPVGEHALTYSIEFMRLHAQACMGLGSLLDLWYKRLTRDDPAKKAEPNIGDYHFIFDDGSVQIDRGRTLNVRGSPGYLVTPFHGWRKVAPPTWWRDYNDTKHHFTLATFRLGNLDNALNALAGFYLAIHDWRTLRTHPLDSKVFEVMT